MKKIENLELTSKARQAMLCALSGDSAGLYDLAEQDKDFFTKIINFAPELPYGYLRLSTNPITLNISEKNQIRNLNIDLLGMKLNFTVQEQLDKIFSLMRQEDNLASIDLPVNIPNFSEIKGLKLNFVPININQEVIQCQISINQYYKINNCITDTLNLLSQKFDLKNLLFFSENSLSQELGIFTESFFHGEFKEFKQIVKKAKEKGFLPQLVGIDSLEWLKGMNHLMENNKLPTSFFIHLMTYGYQVYSDPKFYLPYLKKQVPLDHNIIETKHFAKKVEYVLKSLRGEGEILIFAGYPDIKGYFNALWQELIDPKSKFPQTLENFKNSDYSKLKVLPSEGKNQKKEKLIPKFIKIVEDSVQFKEYASVNINLSDIEKIGTFFSEVTDSCDKTYEKHPGQQKSDILKKMGLGSVLVLNSKDFILNNAKSLVLNRSKNLSSQFLESLTKIKELSSFEVTPEQKEMGHKNKLGSILGYPTDLYGSFENFYEYLKEKIKETGEAVFKPLIKTLYEIALNYEDSKLYNSLKEYFPEFKIEDKQIIGNEEMQKII